MNKVYTNKWNAARGAWVACSEATRRAGKTTVVALALTAVTTGSAWAVTCTPDANGSYFAGWVQPAPNPYTNNCDTVPATTASPTVLAPAASWYVLTRSALTAPNDVVTIGATNISYTGANGFSAIGNQFLTHGSINFTDVTANLTNSGGGGGIGGIGTHSTVAMNGTNFNLTSNSNYTGGNSSGGVASYAVLAGSSVDAAEPASNNGKYSTITLDNATISQTTAGGVGLFSQPILNSGLRAIQGAGSSNGGSAGKIEIKNALNMTLTGGRIEGIYVSGAGTDTNGNEAVSQVILGNTTIKMVKTGTQTTDSSAIKVGKSRAVGTGKGLLVSNGALSIDMDPAWQSGTGPLLVPYQPYMSPAIKMAVSGSQLLANGANSSANINASRSALAIGIDDWGSNVDSQGIQALFSKATVKTQSTTAPLLMADSGQQGVQMLFDNASDLTAASNGYLIDIIKYRSSTNPSSVALTLDHGSIAKGLTNQSYATSTLNVAVNNASTWNLVEKSNGDKTSTYTTFGMTAGSTLNAFKAGAAAFVMNGPVSSDASTINLVDGAPDDVLTVQPSYTGSNGAALAVDTCLAGSGAASDILRVAGDTSGTTVLKVTPFTDAACPGADTTTTGDGKGILVVQVTGNSNAVFSLEGGAVTQGNYVYSLVKVGNDWYLQSQLGTGTITVAKQVNAPADAPAFSGAIPFTLTCSTPAFSQAGSIAVASNQGSAAPITVAAGSTCAVEEGALPTPPAGYRWGPATLPAASAPMASAGAQTLTIVNTLVKDTAQPRPPAPVPTNTPLALGGLSALIGMAALLRQRRGRKHTR
ncbi:hypothetical protein HNP33_000041 [Comamonas odontotermitis]|uniref:Autotransporter outer membrane beta-barrel domain-containing protein n=1 Tax=Comamonas odontotermitis TaxID=379895 RepID=A0ABR6RA15_9BURK|nr:ESPR-type extended signal peptide-containing protein [Comamonas odontotermitis]MBB6575993.1 hypothetical protein [Comamonas odontotermitis]